jgi:signal transduction histidine kinase
MSILLSTVPDVTGGKETLMEAAPVRILIVEDEAAHVEAIRRALETAAFRVEFRIVDSLDGYRKAVAESLPDIALVDLNLPDGNAMEILCHPPETGAFPILVMTSYGTEETAVKTLKAGALDYVVKSPENFATIPRVVINTRRQWHLLQERRQAEEALRQARDELEVRVAERTQELRHTIHILMLEMTKREHAEKELKQSEEKLRFLSSQLLTIQENERKRLAAELHDELGHSLLTLKLNLRAVEKKLLPDQTALQDEMNAQLEYIDQVIEEVRRLYYDLTPGNIEDLGLSRALTNLVDDFSESYRGIDWQVNIGAIDQLFSLPVQTMLYRIMQEGLTNIGKHAEPTRVEIFVGKENSRVVMQIKDNGRGFAAAEVNGHTRKKGMGLLALTERVNLVGGTIDLWSQENQGTSLTITIPVAESALDGL